MCGKKGMQELGKKRQNNPAIRLVLYVNTEHRTVSTRFCSVVL